MARFLYAFFESGLCISRPRLHTWRCIYYYSDCFIRQYRRQRSRDKRLSKQKHQAANKPYPGKQHEQVFHLALPGRDQFYFTEKLNVGKCYPLGLPEFKQV
nr:hypothetical protein [Hymenobacter sp. BT18]